MKWLLMLSASAVCVVLVGCGAANKLPGEKPVYQTVGTVTYKGKPIPDASIRLHPIDGNSETVIPRGTVGPDSKFALTTYRKDDGAPEGEYYVSVSWVGPLDGVDEEDEDRLRERLPKKYTKPETSGVKVTIAADQNELPPIDFK